MPHSKTDSEVTSLAPSSPPRSPRRAPYYVTMSPSHPGDPDKMLSPGASPIHYHFHHHPHGFAGVAAEGGASTPIHHSRESSTGRFSAPFWSNTYNPWRKVPHPGSADGGSGDFDDDEGGDDERGGGSPIRRYASFFLLFVLFFALFSLTLWGASKSYKPIIIVKSMVFESYNIQAGMDYTGVPTKMMTINSTVRISFRNPATFFGVHVTSTPLDLYYYDLKVASGFMGEFYQPRKSGRVVAAAVVGQQVPLYGGGSGLQSRPADGAAAPVTPAFVPLNLTFVVRARAHVLGYLVKSKFYRRVRCGLTLREARLGRPVPDIGGACLYHEGR